MIDFYRRQQKGTVDIVFVWSHLPNTSCWSVTSKQKNKTLSLSLVCVSVSMSECVYACFTGKSDGVLFFMERLKGLVKRDEPFLQCVWVCARVHSRYSVSLFCLICTLPSSAFPLLATPWNGFSLDHYPDQWATLLPQLPVSESA